MVEHFHFRTSKCSRRWRARFEEDGYLLVRGLLDRKRVLSARSAVTQALLTEQLVTLDEKTGHMQSRHGPGKFPGILARQAQFSALPAVHEVLEAPELQAFVAAMSQSGQARPVRFKWLRAVDRGAYTGLHCDSAYFPDPNTLTAWLPLGAVPFENGALLVARGSHKRNRPPWAAVHRVYRDEYVDTAASGPGSDTSARWIELDRFERALAKGHQGAAGAADWLCPGRGGYQPGDVLLLHPDVFHLTVPNQTTNLRLSCDTRWTT